MSDQYLFCFYLFRFPFDNISPILRFTKSDISRFYSKGEEYTAVSYKHRRNEMSRLMTKPTKWPVHPVKTQISLGIHPVWSESSLCTQWVAKDPRFLHADSEDWSDWADAQANLSPRWVHRPFCCFCHEAAQIMKWVRAQQNHVCPSKTDQPVHVVWSESTLSTLWPVKDPNPLIRLCRLIHVFTGC